MTTTVIAISVEVANRLHSLLEKLPEYQAPYKEIGDLCGELRVAPVIAIEDHQQLTVVDIPPETPSDVVGEGSGDAIELVEEEPVDDEKPLRAVADEQPTVADEEETDSGLPPMMKGKTG